MSGALDSYFVLFWNILSSAHQRSLVETEPATSQLESKSLIAAPRLPILHLEFQLYQSTIWCELSAIFLYVTFIWAHD